MKRPTLMASLFGGGGSGGSPALQLSDSEPLSNVSNTLEIDFLSSVICFVHLSYALKHLLHILSPARTNCPAFVSPFPSSSRMCIQRGITC